MKKFILLQLVASILKADKVAGDLAKSFNVTYKKLTNANPNAGRSISSESIFVTSAKVAETQMAINQLLGTTVMLTDEQLTTMTKLREAAGFTNEELAGIAKLSATTGKEMETITGEVLAQAKISSTRLGVVLNERDVVKEISKVSAATTLSLGKSGEAIADAVATAKSLGLELSKVEAIAGSILQFESSIEDELSAELLIGKELNLDRARFAALNNDVATVAKEISSQIGTAAEFGKMNRIEQEALAKAVGMNREELAQTLYVQEQLAGVSGEEAKKKKEF
jgi:DNA-binding XRE family transcriptional regulator